MSQQNYRKCFPAIEANPEIFTRLAHDLGLSSSIVFKDIFTIEEINDPDILAIIMVVPTTDSYEHNKAVEDKLMSHNPSQATDIVFFRQTINNACGLYALLHATCNGKVRKHIMRSTCLESLLHVEEKCRTDYLETSEEIEEHYLSAANDGCTKPPDDINAEVDYHFITFVEVPSSNQLFELDGDRNRPIKRADLGEASRDFHIAVTETIQEYFDREKQREKSVCFNILAVVKQEESNV